MNQFIIPLSAAEGTEADRIGPKAANLAALSRAGLPTPGGFCLSADAYRHQCDALGLGEMLEQFNAASLPEARRISVQVRLKLY
jgi:rifampicin phosphotransferase